MIKTCILALILSVTTLSSSSTFIVGGIPSESPVIRLEFRHPLMDQIMPDVSTLSGTWELSGIFALSGVLDATACIPYSSASPDGGESESAIGNITVGIRSSYRHWQEKGWTGSITMSLPTMADDSTAYFATSIGALTDYFRGFGKYSQKTLTIEAIYSSVNRLNMTNIVLGFEIGPALYIPVENESGGSDVFLEYGGVGSLEFTDLSLSLELVGLLILTEDMSFGERLDHAVVLGGRWLGSAVKPGVFCQLNLGANVDDWVDGVLGLDVEIGL